MKRWQWLRIKSIFPKLVLAFLLTSIPIYSLGWVILNAGMNKIGIDIEQSAQSHLHFYGNEIGSQIDQINMWEQQSIFDNDLENLSIIAPHLSENEIRQSLINLQEKLAVLERASRIVQEVSVYIPMIGKTITAQSFDKPPAQEEIDYFRRNAGKRIYTWNGKLYSSIAVPFRENAPLTSLFEIQLSESDIRRKLAELGEVAQGVSVLIDAQGRWQIGEEPALEKDGLMNRLSQGNLHWKSDGLTFFAEEIPAMNAWLIMQIPEKELLGQAFKYRQWVRYLAILTAVLVVVFAYWIYRLIHKPLRKMISGLRQVEKGNLEIRISREQDDEFRYLYEHFNRMVVQVSALIHENYEQKMRTQQSELKQLQSQINPHFLYNSFFILQRMAEAGNTDKTAVISRLLSQYFRYITRNDSDEETLESELSHALAYAEIQMIRFSGKLQIHVDELADSFKHTVVPRMIVQPIIENAFNHGFRHKNRDWKLAIHFGAEDGKVVMSVMDNGLIAQDELTRLQKLLAYSGNTVETTALLNVHRRLMLKFRGEGGLRLSRSELGGLQVDILIPLGKENGDD
ncbi:sensor histidine kinase [Cohnella sp. GCM10012308]|uniref:sensor histidine kinase n=1 Tax=Cohnella sp. GCM10012308 TaxID=3317329 RepID=UPI0036075ABF